MPRNQFLGYIPSKTQRIGDALTMALNTWMLRKQAEQEEERRRYEASLQGLDPTQRAAQANALIAQNPQMRGTLAPYTLQVQPTETQRLTEELTRLKAMEASREMQARDLATGFQEKGPDSSVPYTPYQAAANPAAEAIRKSAELARGFGAGGDILKNDQLLQFIAANGLATPEQLQALGAIAETRPTGAQGLVSETERRRQDNALKEAQIKAAADRYGADKSVEAASARATATATTKPASAAEKRTMNFYMRAAEADTELEKLEESVKKKGLGGQVRLKFAPNWAQSDENQVYQQLQRQFTEARLRKDSGAAIPPHEYENDARTYFAQPGDSIEVLDRKREARKNLLSALKQEAGRAVPEFFGTEEVEPIGGGGGMAVGERRTFPNGNVGEWDGTGWVLVEK
jgi:hypothetical protein